MSTSSDTTDERSDSTGGRVSRRNFLKTSAAAGAAAAVGGGAISTEADTVTAQEAGDREVVHGNCWICRASCGQEITVEDGKAIDVTGVDGHPKASAGPGREGTLCSKGVAQLDKTYNPNRIRQPYIRKDGELQAVSWDEAIEFAAERLEEFREEHGAEKLLRYQGYPLTDTHDKLWQQIYGAAIQVGRKTTCHGPFSDSWGWMGGYGREWPDYQNSEYIIAWGRNPMECFRGQWTPKGILDTQQNNDATLVTVDPRYTKTAEKSDKWLPIEPRTDGALALAMGHVIIEEGLYDEEFVEEWSYGFEEYREEVADKTPEWAEEITDIDAEEIREIAIGFANAAPKAVAFPWTGIAYQGNGFKNAQAIHALNGLVGSIDTEGGTRHYSGPGLNDPHEERGIDLPDAHEDADLPEYDDYPFQRHIRNYCHNYVPEMVAQGDLKGYVSNWSIPPKSGNTREWIEALEEMELVIVVDAFWNAVSENADIVFPESSQIEQPFIDSGGDSCYPTQKWVTASGAAIDPLWDTKPSFDIYKELAEEMGYGEYFPWNSEEEYLDEKLDAVGMSFDELAEQSYALVDEYDYEQYREDGFNTETGLFQFDLEPNESYAALADELGVSTAPEWQPVDDDLYGETTDDEYPLLFTDLFVEMLSRGHCQALPQSVEEYQDRYGVSGTDYEGNFLHINPEDARPRGIETGDMVRVETRDDAIELPANVYEGVRPGWVGTENGFGKGSSHPEEAGANSMILNKERHVEPVSGQTDRNHPVEVTKVGGDS